MTNLDFYREHGYCNCASWEKGGPWNCCHCTTWNVGANQRCRNCEHSRRPDTKDKPPPKGVARPHGKAGTP